MSAAVPARIAYLLLIAACLSWSGMHIIGRAMAGHVPPYAATMVRWSAPVLLLAPFAWPHLKRDWPLLRKHWLLICLLGLPGGLVFAPFQYIGLQYSTAVNASLLNSTSPVLIAAAGALIFRDRLSSRQMLGISTSLIGVLLIVTRADLGVLLGLQFNLGDLYFLANQTVWAVYSTSLRLRPAIHWTSFLFAMSVLSTLGAAPFFVHEQMAGLTLHADWFTVGALAYNAIFPSLVAFACWNLAVESIGPNRAGAFSHLIPLFSTLLAAVFLGEWLQPYHMLGFATILLGVWLAARGRG